MKFYDKVIDSVNILKKYIRSFVYCRGYVLRVTKMQAEMN